jgi:TRAP-type mannitol/chloroaromatic compound transport system permease small subunit
MVAKLLSGIDRLSEWSGKISSFFILVATFQVCYELVLRYVFNAPTIWGLEMTLYLCGITYVMAGAYAAFHDAHIRVDIFYNRLTRRARGILDLLVTDLLFFFFVGILVWQAADWFWESFDEKLTSGSEWDPIIWPMRFVLLLGSFILLLSGVAKFIRDVQAAFFMKHPAGR